MRSKPFSSSLLVFAYSLTFVIISFFKISHAQQKENDAKIVFGDGLSASISKMRIWESFDGQYPAVDSHQHWIMKGEFQMSVDRFASDKDIAAPKPDGKFWEIVLWFKNDGVEESTLWLSQENDTGMDINMITPDEKKIGMAAFRIPGASVADQSLITSIKGGLGIKLKPKSKTWMLAVFDIPENIVSANLQVMASEPIEVNISAGSKKVFNSDEIDIDGIKIRVESARSDGEYLFIKLNFNTGGEQINLRSDDLILLDENDEKYECEGLTSEGQPAGLLFGGIGIMTITWQEAPDIIAVFHKVPLNNRTLGLKYKNSNALKVK